MRVVPVVVPEVVPVVPFPVDEEVVLFTVVEPDWLCIPDDVRAESMPLVAPPDPLVEDPLGVV